MASVKKRVKYWQARISIKDTNENFTTKSKSGFKTKREAELYGAETEIKANRSQLSIVKELPFPDYYLDWFETYKEANVTQRTKATYIQFYNVIKEYFKDTLTSEIDRRAYQTFISTYGKIHAKSTVSKMNSLIHACVKDAIYDGVIIKDFVQNVSLIYDKKRTKAISYLNIKELSFLLELILDTRNPNFTSKYMIYLAAYTGMLLGEIQGLQWQDVNFQFKTISIKRSWNETEKFYQSTKNESSIRVIRINDSVLTLIKELKDHSVNPSKNDAVFINQYETIPTSSSVNKTLKETLKMLNIDRPGFHFHSLRHTHVAYLLSHNIDLYLISKRLGHSDISTTSKVYSYLIDEYKIRGDNEIEGVLNRINESEKLKINKA